MHTYYKIWIHLVWTTKNRMNMLKKEVRKEIFRHLMEKADIEGYHVDMINGTEDHIHCLISLHPKFSISDIVRKLKGESSHWINSNHLLKSKFAWQVGFSAFSVSESNIDKVRQYILGQEEHHKKMDFTKELEKLLKLHHISQE